jgi:hypothetical protein
MQNDRASSLENLSATAVLNTSHRWGLIYDTNLKAQINCSTLVCDSEISESAVRNHCPLSVRK